MERNNIGWHYWPYKKMTRTTNMVSIQAPENWDVVVEFTRADRSSFANVRRARPDQALVRKALTDLLENMKFANCRKNEGYIKALGMNP